MPRDAEIFRQVANLLSRPAVSRGKVENLGIAGGAADDAEQDFDERRLASPVAAEQAKDFASFDFKRNPLQRFLPFAEDESLGIGLAEVGNGDGGRGQGKCRVLGAECKMGQSRDYSGYSPTEVSYSLLSAFPSPLFARKSGRTFLPNLPLDFCRGFVNY